ncbi:MAG: hypothetical protein P4N41_15310 [Negativicutes bacterium]|nr:hypothetical protein [Negativicutes bacterium]MDR3591020.1 hypothetical protein [Negativicutes bacterium]
MYFWKVDSLREDLRTDSVCQLDKLKYLLAYLLLTVVVAPALRPPTALAIYPLSQLLVILGGTVWCYVSNSRGDGKDFFERYICLQVPLLIRLTLLYFGAIVLLSLVAGSQFSHLMITNIKMAIYLSSALGLGFHFLLFAWLQLHITRLATPVVPASPLVGQGNVVE